MKVHGLLIVLIGLSLTFGSCEKSVKPSDDVTTETRELSGFTSIDVSEAMEVDILFVPGTEQVVVEANSNLHQYVVTEVVGNKLSIHRKGNVKIKPGATIRVYVTASVLNELEVSGASNVEFVNQVQSNSLNLEISDASQFGGSCSSNQVSLKIDGASNVHMSGATQTLTADVSGASSLFDYDFISENLNIDLSGASSASLTVNGVLNVDASGASVLNYKGSGLIQDLKLSGSSTVNKY